MIHDTAPITMSMACSGCQVESVFNTMKYDHALPVGTLQESMDFMDLIVHIRQPTTELCEPGIATTSGHEQPHSTAVNSTAMMSRVHNHDNPHSLVATLDDVHHDVTFLLMNEFANSSEGDVAATSCLWIV